MEPHTNITIITNGLSLWMDRSLRMHQDAWLLGGIFRDVDPPIQSHNKNSMAQDESNAGFAFVLGWSGFIWFHWIGLRKKYRESKVQGTAGWPFWTWWFVQFEVLYHEALELPTRFRSLLCTKRTPSQYLQCVGVGWVRSLWPTSCHMSDQHLSVRLVHCFQSPLSISHPGYFSLANPKDQTYAKLLDSTDIFPTKPFPTAPCLSKAKALLPKDGISPCHGVNEFHVELMTSFHASLWANVRWITIAFWLRRSG